MHYAENECVMPIGLHCNEIRALCLTTNAICRTAEIGALLLKCVLIVYIWPEKGVAPKQMHRIHQKCKHGTGNRVGCQMQFRAYFTYLS